jgi:putative SOS response-associated peptidase YedK
MCGRFTLTVSPEQLKEAFSGLTLSAQGPQPRFNIAPSQPVAAIPNDGKFRLEHFTWGLVPFWAKDPKIGNRMINARSETAAEKPSFRAAFRYRRCLIPADGFYEWKKTPGQKAKTPMYIQMKDGQPFAFAGLWEDWNGPDGSNILSCTILTTQPNDLIKDIHNRMPVILPPQAYDLWLTPGEVERRQLQGLLSPYPSEEMKAHAVSRLVNNPANDEPACIVPALS